MINDEFTNSKSNNAALTPKSEFGNIPDNEFSGSGEMNLHKAAYDASLMKSQETTKAVETTSQTTSSTAVESTTVASSTTMATGIAATSAGVITVASTVAIGALSVFAVVSDTVRDYQVTLDSMRVIGDSMSYLVSVYDMNMSEEDYDEYFREKYEKYDDNQSQSEEIEIDYPFVVKLYNLSYEATQPADFLSNEGTFQNIVLGDKYTIEVSEDKFGGDVLFETTFVATASYSFNDFSFPTNVDLEKGTFDIYMEFEDETDTYSDFVLYLYDLDAPEQVNYTFNLEKISGSQTVIGDNDPEKIDIFKDWGYKFSFKENGETVVYKEGVAHFEDVYGRKSGFNEFIFDKTYSYKEGTMEVRLDFDNDFGWYDNFVLTLTAHYVEEDPTTGDGSQTWTDDREIELQTTTDVQTIDVMGLDLNLMDPNVTFTYVLTADVRGVASTLVEENEPFSLTDNSGAKSEWNQFIFNKTANFLEDSFEVQLDYVDDFYYYDNFTLTLLPSGVNAQYDFHLDPTTEVQTCTFDAQQHWNYSFDYEYSYSLTCSYQGAIRTLDSEENFKFTDTSGFLGLDFDGTYDYGTNDFSLKLNYEDPDNNFSNFVFHLTYEDDPSEPSIDISLEKTTEVQSFDLDDYELYTGTWYEYNLTCDYKGNAVTLVTGEESFQFSDPDLVPSGSITFVNNEVNYHDGTMWVQFDYTDKYNMISSAWLVFYGKNSEDQDDYCNESTEIYLEVTKEVQEINIADINTGEEDGINFTKYNLAYDLYYEYYTDTDTDTSSLYGSPHPITLSNSAVTAVNGYESKFQVFEEMDAAQGYAQTYMYIYFDAVDENDMWSSYKAYWEGVNPANGSTFVQADIQFNERELGGWHKAEITCGGASDDIFNGDGWDLVVVADINNPYTGYTATDEEIYRIEDTKPVYVDAPDPEIFNIDFSESVFSYGGDDYALNVQPMFAGDYSQYTDVQFIFEQGDGTTYTYSISFSDYFDFYVTNPDEGPIDVWNEFENIEFKVTLKYCTYVNGVKSDPITKVLYTGISFYVSV